MKRAEEANVEEQEKVLKEAETPSGDGKAAVIYKDPEQTEYLRCYRSICMRREEAKGVERVSGKKDADISDQDIDFGLVEGKEQMRAFV